jgi:hypothetical protein
MRLASYTGTRPGLAGLFNRAVRAWLWIPYSHSELVFSDGQCFSCSWLDGGARFKAIQLRPEHWHIIDVPSDYQEAITRQWAQAMVDRRTRYSLLMLAAFVLPPLLRLVRENREVCSSAIALALGIKDPRRFDPYELALHIAAGQSSAAEAKA